MGAGVRPPPRGGAWKPPFARFGVPLGVCDVALRVCDIVCYAACCTLSVLLCPALFSCSRVGKVSEPTFPGQRYIVFFAICSCVLGAVPKWGGFRPLPTTLKTLTFSNKEATLFFLGNNGLFGFFP